MSTFGGIGRKAVGFHIFTLAAGSLGAAGALAQTGLTPGAIMETLPQGAPSVPAPQTDRTVVLPAPLPESRLDPDAPRFTVSAFRMVGNHAIDSATLQGLVAEQVGKAYNLFDLQKVTRAITEYYRQHGYPVARAVIPAQKVEAGVVQIEIIEGRFDRLMFKGNAMYSEEFLQRWGQPLLGQAVRLAPLEERILTIDDLPGLSLRTVLVPGEEYGTTTVATEVQEKPVEGQASLNNSGRQEVGEHRFDATLSFNNPLRLGDQLSLRGSLAENELLKMVGINYSLPIGIGGDRLAFSYTHVVYRIGGSLADLGIEGKSELGSISYSHPFLRSLKENFFGTLSVRSFHGTQSIDDTQISNNEVVVPEIGIAWNKVYENFDVAAGGLRASSNFRNSDKGTDKRAHKFKLDGEISRLFRITNHWDFKLAASGQWAPDALADSEKFSAGGPNSVRGYAPADIRGDSGAVFNAEGRYRFEAVGRPAYFSLYADAGYVSRRYPDIGQRGDETISSVAAGLTFFPADSVTAQLVAAVPTGGLKPSDEHKNSRLWFTLSTTF